VKRPRRMKTSLFYLKVTQRSVHSWTRWRLKRTTRRVVRETRRLSLMQMQVDLQQVVEMLESQQFREKRELPPTPQVVSLTPEEEIALRSGLALRQNSSPDSES
jgi:phenylpropionate dioxygenase-like ring-hydroxylating dioxygenase large terminal subunit